MVLEKRRTLNINKYAFMPESSGMTEEIITSYIRMSYIYRGAMSEVSTKLDILDEEFSVTYDHNPIHHMVCRLKSAESAVGKLTRKGIEVSTQNIMEYIQDVAGIRVVCNYVDDIYRLVSVLEKHKDLRVIRKTDYIEEPKANGYRSLHLVVEVPVVISEMIMRLPVEIQLRTIAMDMWASLEHELHYKSNKNMPSDAIEELRSCAEELAVLDIRMQNVSKTVVDV